jgi:hypothetical protein
MPGCRQSRVGVGWQHPGMQPKTIALALVSEQVASTAWRTSLPTEPAFLVDFVNLVLRARAFSENILGYILGMD